MKKKKILNLIFSLMLFLMVAVPVLGASIYQSIDLKSKTILDTHLTADVFFTYRFLATNLVDGNVCVAGPGRFNVKGDKRASFSITTDWQDPFIKFIFDYGEKGDSQLIRTFSEKCMADTLHISAIMPGTNNFMKDLKC